MELAGAFGEGMGWRREDLHEKCGNMGNFLHSKQEIQILSLYQMLFHVLCPSPVSLEKQKLQLSAVW